jgi:predicted Zn-dependent protease
LGATFCPSFRIDASTAFLDFQHTGRPEGSPAAQYATNNQPKVSTEFLLAKRGDAALALDPLSPIVNVNYAVVLMYAHRFAESEAQFKKALDRDPTFPPAHYKLSQLYATQGRFKEAVAEISKSLEVKPNVTADA